jgi:hypothetical protein
MGEVWQTSLGFGKGFEAKVFVHKNFSFENYFFGTPLLFSP